jgi:hypothetical protein
MLKLFVFVPDEKELIKKIMNAATNAGAGVIGNYTGCGFITKGTGNWKSEEGSNPTIGRVGVYSHEPEVRIEMICPETRASSVKKAILKVHPYEEPEIDFVKLIDVE